jgi:hypothetical protein
MEKSQSASVDESASIAVGLADLPSESHESIEVLQGIISAPNAEIYRERLRLGFRDLSTPAFAQTLSALPFSEDERSSIACD